MNNRRIGKVARLPEEIRDHVNELLDDGAEYSQIIDYLAQNGFPGFSPANLSHWKSGGYQDWRRHCDRLDELALRAAYAADLLRSADTSKLQQATLNLTAIQFFDLINRFDPLNLTHALNVHPHKFPAVINSLAKFMREIVRLERFRADQQERARRQASAVAHEPSTSFN